MMPSPASLSFDDDVVASLCEMGFCPETVLYVLQATGGNLEQALEMLLVQQNEATACAPQERGVASSTGHPDSTLQSFRESKASHPFTTSFELPRSAKKMYAANHHTKNHTAAPDGTAKEIASGSTASKDTFVGTTSLSVGPSRRVDNANHDRGSPFREYHLDNSSRKPKQVPILVGMPVAPSPAAAKRNSGDSGETLRIIGLANRSYHEPRANKEAVAQRSPEASKQPPKKPTATPASECCLACVGCCLHSFMLPF